MFARIACQPFLKIEDMENLGENFPQIQIVFGSRLGSCRCFGKTRAGIYIFGEETSKEKYLLKKSVKFKDLRVALNYLEKGHFKFSFDIRSGYHHVLVFPPHQSFLGFSWLRLDTFVSGSFHLGFPQSLIFSQRFQASCRLLEAARHPYRNLPP